MSRRALSFVQASSFRGRSWQGTQCSSTVLNVGGELHVERMYHCCARKDNGLAVVVVTVLALSSPVDLFVGCFFKLEIIFPLPTDFEDSFLPPSGG